MVDPKTVATDGVCVLAPTVQVTITIEAAPHGDSVHIHAGGQGLWVARLLARLGVPVTLCTVVGGEAGRVTRALIAAEADAGADIVLRAVARDEPTGAYVHDRRDGTRREIAEDPGSALGRHETDELYGAALVAGIEAGTCVLTGPRHEGHLSADFYRRMTCDLARQGVRTVADLSGPTLDAALVGGLSVLKVSDEDLARDGQITDTEVPALMRWLDTCNADLAVVTRADRPMLASVDGDVHEVTGPVFETADHRGCGDAFTAALTAALVWGIDPIDALRWGSAAGALTATRHGLATAHRNELHRLLHLVTVEKYADGCADGT